MDTTALIVLIVCAVVVIVALAGALYWQRRRSGALREGFGPEYERTVRETGSKSKAERELESRRKRVEALDIRDLTPDETKRYQQSWRDVQARFVDQPKDAIADADRLLNDVMQKKGYPVGDFERRAADVSVDHPNVVSNYRIAHDIARANDGVRQPQTEQLRQAMIHYRSLFEDLVGNEQQSRKVGTEQQARKAG